jgi:predicted ATPase/DNA-binding SARP family transcriptional activator
VRIEVLGTPAVSGHTGEAAGASLGGRRAQVALVALTLERSSVTSDRLADMIWAGERPATWQAALRGVIRGLRTVLRQVSGDQPVILTEPGGYRIASGIEVDLFAAEDAVSAAAELNRRGRHRAALDAAGPVTRISGSQLLAGEDHDWLRPHRAIADALARQALEITITAAGSAGDHVVAISAARRAVSSAPLDEYAHRLLIRALDLAGDRAGAVSAYEECRAALADQLGVDPSAETVQTYVTAMRDQPPSSGARVPVHASSFIGREQESTRLLGALGRPGLVTVSGLGGVGKSRLTAQVAGQAGGFPGGRIWVPLGAVTEDVLVAATVALHLGVPPGTEDAADAVAGRLTALGRTLLILDGCESARDGTASLVTTLRAQCPQLSIAVTSRVPLRLDGEPVIMLDPLSSPADPADLLTSPLARLLTDRVREGGGNLEPGSDFAPHLVALLQRCAGLPLAVELVAAHLAAIPAGDLLDQLDPLLAGSADPLRAIAQASYAMLDDKEASVFRRFAVLSGSASLALVRQVVSDQDVPPVRVVRILRELTASGLLNVDRGGARWRYQQDDDLARFAREMLVSSGEEGAAYARLADAIRALLPADAREPAALYQDAVSDMLGSVRSLLRAGVSGRADSVRCLEIAFRLHRYWAATNVAEGRYWLRRLLAAAPQDEQWGPYATYALGYLGYWSGDADSAVRDLRTAVSRLDSRTDSYAARALIYLAGLLDDQDQVSEALECVSQAIEAARPFGTDLQVAAVMGMGGLLSERGHPDAVGYAVQAIELCHAGGSAEQLAAALPTAAMVCWQVGANQQARAFADEAGPMHGGGAKRIARVVLLSVVAGLALDDGDLDGAVDIGSAADREGSELGVEREMPLIRAVLARALLASGDLAGAADRAAACVSAALAMTFAYPLAIGLETACLVLHAAGLGTGAQIGRLLDTAAAIRAVGDRPAPAGLGRQVQLLRAAVPVTASGLATSTGALASEGTRATGRRPAGDAIPAAGDSLPGTGVRPRPAAGDAASDGRLALELLGRIRAAVA